jgi:Cu(I)/Ag(I) efflux system membrane protein CusA/SilA
VLFYMPSTGPGISIGEAGRLLRLTDSAIRRFPEVERVLGKAGRAETPTDPAPLSMFETIVTLRPRSEWRAVDTWYSGWAPEWLKVGLRRITSDRLSPEELVRQLNEAVSLPGLSNAWTMPIRGRTAMLTTGIRTPVGLKVAGSDPATIEALGTRIEGILAPVPGTRSVFAERVSVGHFLDIRWKREELARYGISLEDAQAVVEHAIGGENVSTTIEGRERYPVNVRYQADFRTDVDAIGRITVAAADGRRQVPVAELAEVATTTGPSMIRNEDGMLTGYVLIDLADRDPGGYVAEARAVLAAGLTLPPGYVVSWSGQYEAMARVTERLRVVVPMTLFAVLVLLYLNTRSWIKTWIILLAMPFSAVGAIWLLYLLGYNMSVGVWVGVIALLGVDAGTGVFMLLYLDLAYAEAKKAGRLRNRRDLRDAILAGAVSRLRPKFMTAATMMIGMMPIMWSAGTGSDVMKRIAAPMIGGMVTSFLLELMIYPPLYEIWKSRTEVRSP